MRNTKPCEVTYINCSDTIWQKYLKKVDVEFEGFELAEDITNWSSVIRLAVQYLQPHIRTCIELSESDIFIDRYNKSLNTILDTTDVKPNNNFVRRLFRKDEVDNLITSTVYRNNSNHCINIFTDLQNNKWCACAVFTGEIIWVIGALLDTINSIYKEYLPSDKYNNQPVPAFDIRYIIKDREDGESKENSENGVVYTIINDDLANDLVTLFLNASILQIKAPTEMKEDLDLMKSKYVEIAKKNNIDLIGIMRDMIS